MLAVPGSHPSAVLPNCPVIGEVSEISPRAVKKVKKNFSSLIPPIHRFFKHFSCFSILQATPIRASNEISPKKGDRFGETFTP